MDSKQAARDRETPLGERTITRRFVEKHPGSAAHFERALNRLPGGITHDSRYVDPFNLCITRADGAYKWDCDGNRYIDLVTGHGALILGHSHPDIVEAVSNQMQRGTHFGGNHALELEWADRICDLVPGAESVRFTGTGSEAVVLAIRLARAFTGRQGLVKFNEHFHGWGDTVMAGTAGVPDALESTTSTIPCGDIDVTVETLKDESAAAVIIEPSNPSFFAVEDPSKFLKSLRDVTRQYGTLLIVDEVVSGFRWAPGGAQEYYGAYGDLTTLAKILAGGLPGGAVAGRRDILNLISFNPDDRAGKSKVRHPGTFNANPLSAASGIACLKIVEKPEIQNRATSAASAIRSGMNDTLRSARVPGCVYGASSMFRIALGGEELPQSGDLVRPLPGAPAGRYGTSGQVGVALNLEMMNRGVHLHSSRGITSIAHTDSDVEFIVDAFAGTIEELASQGLLPQV